VHQEPVKTQFAIKSFKNMAINIFLLGTYSEQKPREIPQKVK